MDLDNELEQLEERCIEMSRVVELLTEYWCLRPESSLMDTLDSVTCMYQARGGVSDTVLATVLDAAITSEIELLNGEN